MPSHEAYPENVDGPFYVENRCCTSCSVWVPFASGLIRYTDDGLHCYFYRQPVNQEEVDIAIDTLDVSDLACMRYRGTDPDILKALADRRLSDQCDYPAGTADEM